MANEDKTHDLGVNDVATLIKLVQLACKKGVIEASELTLVGGLYDKLVNIASYVFNKLNDEENKIEDKPQSVTAMDMQVAKSLIDVCTERGVYKAADLQLVSDVYKKVSLAIDNSQKVSEAPASAPSQE
tara:strand:+ start:84 stop:470 length:387 start_codon:yes stop_codon:yes gene_type:complete